MIATLTFGGWVFMLASTLGTTGVTVWCFWRVLTMPDQPEDPNGVDR